MSSLEDIAAKVTLMIGVALFAVKTIIPAVGMSLVSLRRKYNEDV